MERSQEPKWLVWAKELQFLTQAGLTYTKDPFDRERFQRIRDIAAEMVAEGADLPTERVKDLFCNEVGFQTPKLDTRAALFDGDGIFLARGVYYIHVPAVVHAGEAFVIQGFDICRFAVPRRRRRVVRLRGEACGVCQHKRSQYSE